jgi:hypothetical protein
MNKIIIRYNNGGWDVGNLFEDEGYFLAYHIGYRTRRQAEAARLEVLRQIQRNVEEGLARGAPKGGTSHRVGPE